MTTSSPKPQPNNIPRANVPVLNWIEKIPGIHWLARFDIQSKYDFLLVIIKNTQETEEAKQHPFSLIVSLWVDGIKLDVHAEFLKQKGMICEYVGPGMPLHKDFGETVIVSSPQSSLRDAQVAAQLVLEQYGHIMHITYPGPIEAK